MTKLEREQGRAIRAKCLDCSGGMRAEVRDCRMKDCPLWLFRGAGAGTDGGAADIVALKGARTAADQCVELVGQVEINEILREVRM